MKKAVIVLPGIKGSNIFDSKTEEILWPIFTKYSNIQEIMQSQELQEFLNLKGPKGAFTWLDKLTIEYDGTPRNDCKVKVLDQGENATYGSANAYKDLTLYLKNNCKNYEVRCFEYDWRLNNIDSANKLEAFINENGYDKVILVAHSMGGLVASNYIAKSVENREKVLKFIPIATPFLGSHEALAVACNPFRTFGQMQGMFAMAQPIIEMMNGPGSFEEMCKRFMYFLCNVETLYELLPAKEFMKAYDDKDSELYNHAIISVNSDKITKYEDVIDYLSRLNWANKGCFKKMENWHSKCYVDKTQASKLVDTTYIVGNEVSTVSEVVFNDLNQAIDPFVTMEGDGMVPLYSSTCGLSVKDAKVVEFKGISHNALIHNEDTLRKVSDIINSLA